jgi:hypothetical protein
MKGKQCPLALWYLHNRKDLTIELTEVDKARFETGVEVGELAMQRISGGVEVTSPYWDIESAIRLTLQMLDEGCEVIYEATSIHPQTGAYSRIDILRKAKDIDSWDLIEVKSSTSVEDYHYDDVSFQYYVFNGAGFRINKCYLMHIDRAYIRRGEIDVNALFQLEDITEEVVSRQSEVLASLPGIISTLDKTEEIQQDIGVHCFTPFSCGYKKHCWKHISDYSIFDVFTKEKAFSVAEELGGFEVNNIPPEDYPSGRKMVDLLCHKKGKIHADKDKLSEFISDLEYPLYYLDYETINPAVPLFDDSRPYQQIPFQFSLHIQRELGEAIEHHEFLHDTQTDPRPFLTEKLVRLCGETGSIVVYNQSFEEGRNKELAEFLPEFANKLFRINERMIDFLVPFRSRWLYSPDQKGSASIKYVLPAFTEISYESMEISNGGEALMQYEKFAKGKMSQKEQKKMFSALKKYCELDTYAMIEIEQVLRKYSL